MRFSPADFDQLDKIRAMRQRGVLSLNYGDAQAYSNLTLETQLTKGSESKTFVGAFMVRYQFVRVIFMKIAVASEHRGYKAKDGILSLLRELKHDALDFGPTNDEVSDYPDYASKAASAVSLGEIDRAILVGGTGIGMTIVANKFNHVRAALCHDDLAARISRSHNDANILVLAADLYDADAVQRMVRVWLETPFDGGRHARRNEKIAQVEQSLLKRRSDS